MFDSWEAMHNLAKLIPALPLAGALLTALLGPKVLKSRAHWPVVIGLAGSAVAAMLLLVAVNHRAGQGEFASDPAAARVTLWQWASISPAMAAPPAAVEAAAKLNAAEKNTAKLTEVPFTIDVTLRIDPLTSLMLAMVTFVSTLVAIYSIGYMHGERGYWRYFSYVGVFVFSMTMLVSVSNFLLLYVFWEAVGVCSYLLIGFWYQKPAAAAAGKKAFLVNRVGDFGFALGVFLIWTTYGTLNFHDTTPPGGQSIAGVLGQTRLASLTASKADAAHDVDHAVMAHPAHARGHVIPDSSLYVGGGWGGIGTIICLLLLVGACGKSAQFPLHVWLPDAMEGPTPVSALIHAATMVTAGIYLVVRCTPLFFISPEAQLVVSVIGGVTALMAAIIAVTQTDLKRVLAYSTVSQLGYMFLGLGTCTLIGATSGMFHLITHAFFKALLFMGAGSVMHSLGGVIDMRRFSGLRHKMPITCWTFLIGCLALAGVLPFAGFWSKDMILAAVHERAHEGGTSMIAGASIYHWLYWAGTGTALLTAFYTFRAFFLTFYGPEKFPGELEHPPHESPPTMTIPLAILAAFAAGLGLVFEMTGWFDKFLLKTPSLAFAALHETSEVGFHPHVAVVSTVTVIIGIGLAAFFYLGERTQIDRIAAWMRPLYRASYGKLWFDEIYEMLIVKPLLLLAQLAFVIDRYLIDGIVNLIGRLPLYLGALLRPFQNGLIQSYALAMILGALILIGTLALAP
ncbi:MAG: NADH-quinone oxidoreductase subunit L [Planctomycetes bacterium]|nr:NADH-quinone oxidoreductase subunit L [Planctomycetota bacterium]